jgi:hypothetical protein
VSAPVTITVGGGNTPPTPVIDTPSSSLTWAVGDTISFSGHATDAEDGTLPASALTWSILLEHCTTGCHTHPVENLTSSSFVAPDHVDPANLVLTLTATDAGGLSASTTIRLQPKLVNLTFQTNPSGLQLTAGATTAKAPFTIPVIQNATVGLIAPNQKYRGKIYEFASWSDGGAQTHIIRAPTTNTTYTATFRQQTK